MGNENGAQSKSDYEFKGQINNFLLKDYNKKVITPELKRSNIEEVLINKNIIDFSLDLITKMRRKDQFLSNTLFNSVLFLKMNDESQFEKEVALWKNKLSFDSLFKSKSKTYQSKRIVVSSLNMEQIKKNLNPKERKNNKVNTLFLSTQRKQNTTGTSNPVKRNLQKRFGTEMPKTSLHLKKKINENYQKVYLPTEPEPQKQQNQQKPIKKRRIKGKSEKNSKVKLNIDLRMLSEENNVVSSQRNNSCSEEASNNKPIEYQNKFFSTKKIGDVNSAKKNSFTLEILPTDIKRQFSLNLISNFRKQKEAEEKYNKMFTKLMSIINLPKNELKQSSLDIKDKTINYQQLLDDFRKENEFLFETTPEEILINGKIQRGSFLNQIVKQSPRNPIH